MELCQVCHQTEQHLNSKQCNSLEIVFLLQIVLEMPEPRLVEILKEINNKWINICRRCTQLLEQCRGISLELGEIFRRFRERKLELVNIVRQREEVMVEQEFLEECWSFAKGNDYQEWSEPLFKVLCNSETLVVEIQNEEEFVKKEATEIVEEGVFIGPDIKPEADEDEGMTQVEGLTIVNPDSIIQPQTEIRVLEYHQEPLAFAVAGTSRKRKSTVSDDYESWKEDTDDESVEEEVDDDDDEEYDPKNDSSYSSTKRRAKYRCSACQKCFKKYGVLKNHIKSQVCAIKKPAQVQKEDVKLCEQFCNFCSNKYYNKYQLQNHVAEFHDKTKSFICPECEKEFPFKNFLEHHLNVIHGPVKGKAFQCNQCDFGSIGAATALAHKLEAHSRLDFKLKVIQNGVNCPLEKCSVVVKDFKKLGDHLRRNHSDQSVEKTLGEMFGLYKKPRTI